MINFETIGRKLDSGIKSVRSAKPIGRVKSFASSFAESYKDNLAAIKAARQTSKDKADAKRLWKEWQEEYWKPEQKEPFALFSDIAIKYKTKK